MSGDAAAAAETYVHPYVPRDLELPGFVPNFLTIVDILIPYATGSLLAVLLVWFFSGRWARVSKTDRLIMCWWIFTGLTHIVLEGYFVFSPEFYKKKTSCYLAEVWKEYSKADSRYAARNSAVVSVEGITAVLEGPASLLAVTLEPIGKLIGPLKLFMYKIDKDSPRESEVVEKKLETISSDSSRSCAALSSSSINSSSQG